MLFSKRSFFQVDTKQDVFSSVISLINNQNRHMMKGEAVMSVKTSDFLKGVLVGGLIGAAIGILFAPKSGKETREDIARKTDEIMKKAKEECDLALEKSKLAYETAIKKAKEIQMMAREKVENVEEAVVDLAEKGKETLQDNKSRLKKALDAGIEAFKEEKGKMDA
jgi:gas vesicle protein